MNWIVQNSSISDEATANLLDKLYDLEIPYKTVGMIEYTDKIIGIEEVDPKADNIFYGSTKLVELLKDSEFSKNIYYNDNFNTFIWNRNRKDMLNSDCITMPLSMFLEQTGSYFVRPIEDLKKFKGEVVDENKKEWYDRISHGGYSVSLDVPVSISSIKDIVSEYRFFIVNGKVVTGSLYRILGRLKSERVTETALNKAQKYADEWLPHENVVMDLAMTTEGDIKVIEFNCFNASGFYACDIEKIIRGMSQLGEGVKLST